MKPKKMLEPVSEIAEECYEAGDYATPGALDVLYREEQFGAAAAVLREHGHFMGDIAHLDPMEVLILLEEYDEQES